MRRSTKQTLKSLFCCCCFLLYKNKAQSRTASLPAWRGSPENLKVVRNQEQGFIFQTENITFFFVCFIGIHLYEQYLKTKKKH